MDMNKELQSIIKILLLKDISFLYVEWRVNVSNKMLEALERNRKLSLDIH